MYSVLGLSNVSYNYLPLGMTFYAYFVLIYLLLCLCLELCRTSCETSKWANN